MQLCHLASPIQQCTHSGSVWAGTTIVLNTQLALHVGVRVYDVTIACVCVRYVYSWTMSMDTTYVCPCVLMYDTGALARARATTARTVLCPGGACRL